jgi:hypothetical protein
VQALLAQPYAAALALRQAQSEKEDGLPDLPEVESARAKPNLAAFLGWCCRECFDLDPLLNGAPCMGDQSFEGQLSGPRRALFEAM